MQPQGSSFASGAFNATDRSTGYGWRTHQTKRHLIQEPTGVGMATNPLPLTVTSLEMLDSYTTHRKTTALTIEDIEVKLDLVLHLSSSHKRLSYKFCHSRSLWRKLRCFSYPQNHQTAETTGVHSTLVFRPLSFRTPYPASYSFCSSRKSLVSSDLIAPAARVEGISNRNLTYASDAELINFAIQSCYQKKKITVPRSSFDALASGGPIYASANIGSFVSSITQY